MTSISQNHYHTLSLGSGEAGKYICWTLSSTNPGLKTGVIEHKYLGGSCPNIACLPSKNIIYAADVVHQVRESLDQGIFKSKNEQENSNQNASEHRKRIMNEIDVDVNMSLILARKRTMVTSLIDMHKSVFGKSGAELILGHGELQDAHTIEVKLQDGTTKLLTADNIIISTGSWAKIPDLSGLKDAQPLTHVEILELEEVPPHLVVLVAYRRFGAQVTIIERGSRILSTEDEDVSGALMEILEGEGIRICTSTTVSNVSGRSGSSVTLTGTTETGANDDTPFSLTGTHILVATGRIPNTSNCGLENADIHLTPTNHVKVNTHLQTNIPHIFAVGDCANSPHFTHIAFDDFRIVHSVLSQNTDQTLWRSTENRQIPYTLYTDPELAHVGFSETAARTAGIQYRLAKLPMKAFLRTRTMGKGDSERGFAKVLVSRDDDTILGFTALGPRAGELLPVVQLAMAEGLGYEKIRGLIITHPSMNEGLVALFGAVPAREG